MSHYIFDVTRDDARRQVELRAEQTLEELHEAIQMAFGGEAGRARLRNRSYSFFMSGQAWDENSEYTALHEGRWAEAFGKAVLPPLDERQRASIERQLANKFGQSPDIADDVLAALQKPAGGPRDTRTARIADLGLEVGQEFLYLFDYANEQHFIVRVSQIE